MKLLRKQAPLLWLLSIPLISLLYALQDHKKPVEHVLSTHFDRITPFVPVFSVFYFFWYPFLLLVLALVFWKSSTAYYRSLAAVCIGILLANIVFLVYPTHVPRPTLGKGWNYFVPITYKLDEPYNGFPSIHVITSYVLLRAAGILSKRVRFAVAAMAWLIILSTMFIKQHVIADVVSGIAIGEFVFRLTGKFARAKERERPLSRETNTNA
ncbi:phosphatase PAP2 family protein [Paenibacillus rhizovicinus]|uniref:Phosphatase PAP2 family protein n=1 Tax=Paenibacillus rhizovicinus TaxID=2704463 RepID=A0A6C0NUG4_9BACL|nr:phosphatase PAP2 family protein [Paenibacillus rhizovicinus]QHW29849.1 phosphatase PAP2 family protein [Paenibacillus rhizovicinus]